MALQEEITKNSADAPGASILDGAALVIVSPIVVPALLLGLRPVAKTFIKGSLFLTDTVTRLAMATGEGWNDLLAEVRTQASSAPAPDETGTMAGVPSLADAAPRPDTKGTASVMADTTAESLPQEDEDDLQRITGIGSKWAALLEAASVDTVRELARRNPANLHEKLLQVNKQGHIVDLVPSLEQVTDWIVQSQDKVT